MGFIERLKAAVAGEGRFGWAETMMTVKRADVADALAALKAAHDDVADALAALNAAHDEIARLKAKAASLLVASED